MRFDRVNAPISELPQRAALAAAHTCVHCQFGLQPVRLRRRWVHHFPDTGTIVVCEERNQKPTVS